MSVLERAIISVFSGTAVAEGNAFLLSFVETDAAWGEALGLFENQNEVVRYFAANIVYTKVKRHWSQLSGEQRDSVFRVLMSAIDNATTTTDTTRKQFYNRVLLALSCVCAYAPGGLQIYIQSALRKLDFTSSGINSSIAQLALEMLSVLPQEVDMLDLTHAVRVEHQEQLLEASSAVMLTIDSIAKSIDHFDDGIKIWTIKALRSWLLVGITLSKLSLDHESSLRLVYQSLQSGNFERIKEGCAFIREIVCTTEYPSGKSRDAAVLDMVNHIIASIPFIVPLLTAEGGDDDDGVAHEVCTTIVSLTTQEIHLLGNPQACNPNLFDLLLLFAAFKPRKIASLTFDVWLTLQEVPVVDRHPYVTQEVFYKLMCVLLDQCSYPATWVSSGDQEDFMVFRDVNSSNNVHEVLVACFYALQDTFFSLLGERISSLSLNRVESSWNALECVLFVLQAVMEPIKNAVSVNSEGAAVPLQFLFSILQMVLSMPPQCIEQGELNSTACKFIGSLTFLLTGSSAAEGANTAPFRELFASSLEFVFRSVENRQASKPAAKAVYQLCIHGREALTTASSTAGRGEQEGDYMICNVVAATAHLLANYLAVEDESLASVIEGVVRCIVKLPHGLASRQINSLGQIIIDSINKELVSAEASSIERIGRQLVFASHLVKFCDEVPPNGEGKSHVLLDFLTSLWPQLRAVEGHPHFHDLGALSIHLLAFYSAVIMSASGLVMAEVPRITQTIVTMFSLRGEGSAASLRCAKCIVDILSENEESRVFLAQLVEYLTNVFYSRVEQAAAASQSQSSAGRSESEPLWGYDPECIEAFFDVLLTCLCSSPGALASSSALPKVLQLCLATLRVSKERKTVQGVLQVLQTLYYPTSSKISEFHQVFFTAAHSIGPQLLAIIVGLINGNAPSTLWGNVSECLLGIISGCEDAQNSVADCRLWVQTALGDAEVLPKLSPEDKAQVLTLVFDLAKHSPRKYKAFMIDLCKIGSGILPVDALGAHV